MSVYSVSLSIHSSQQACLFLHCILDLLLTPFAIRANYAILFFFSLNANMCFEIDNTRVLYEIINDQQQNKQVHAGADPGFGVGGGAKFGKVIWEYYYYCLRCLWNVWCRKINLDLQVIMIIWGEETKPLFSLCVFFLLHLFFFFVYLGFFWAPLWIRQWNLWLLLEESLVLNSINLTYMQRRHSNTLDWLSKILFICIKAMYKDFLKRELWLLYLRQGFFLFVLR